MIKKDPKVMKQLVKFSTIIFFISNFFFIDKLFANETNPRNKLTTEATLWVSQQLKISEEKINVIAPDQRVRIIQCKGKLNFDFPFDSKETIRAKCDNPNWQFFLRVSSKDSETLDQLRPKIITKKKTIEKTYKKVLTANKNLNKGEILKKKDTSLKKIVKSELPVDVFTEFEGLEFFEIVKNIKSGEPIRAISIRPAKLIKKGNKVQFSILARGMLVTATVEALQDGRMGEQIKLINKESGNTVFGIVTGKNEVSGL